MVRSLHALGLAGGTGCEDDVHDVFGVDWYRSVDRLVPARVRRLDGGRVSQALRDVDVRLGYHRPHIGRLVDLGSACRRNVDARGHVCGTRGQHAQHGYDLVRSLGQSDRHTVAASDSAVDQQRRHATGGQ